MIYFYDTLGVIEVPLLRLNMKFTTIKQITDKEDYTVTVFSSHFFKVQV